MIDTIKGFIGWGIVIAFLAIEFFITADSIIVDILRNVYYLITKG